MLTVAYTRPAVSKAPRPKAARVADQRSSAPAALRPLYEVPGAASDLYEEIADCPMCPLARTRTQTVPGSGPLPCDLVFIGEGPGQREDELGLPFVGRSGQFLDELLASIGRSREDVYVTNVVKCRPPGNRDPEPAEIAACGDYLHRQIELARPRVIATLGRFSMARWFPGDRISAIHGQPKWVDGVAVIPMYHPAAALRNGSLREVMMQDFARIPALLQEASNGR
jgi:uracil-DNA glycosylase